MKRHHLTLGGFVWPLLAAALIWTLVLHQYSLKSGFGFLLAALMIGWPLLAMLLWSLPSLLLGMVTTPQQRAARRKRRKDAGHDRSNPIRAWVRRAAFRADRYRCVYCRQKFRRGRGLEADHYWPYSCGGLANIFNVFALCKYHNDVKSNYWVDPDGYVHYRPYMVHSDPVLAAAILAAERQAPEKPAALAAGRLGAGMVTALHERTDEMEPVPVPYGADETSRVHCAGRTLTVVRRGVRPVLDENWTATDAAGHQHAYGDSENPYPTLTRVSDGLAEPSENPDDPGDIERYHLACVQCGEKMWPSPSGPATDLAPGGYSYWIDGEPVSRRDARQFTDLIRMDNPERWERLRYWRKYSAGLVPHGNQSRSG